MIDPRPAVVAQRVAGIGRVVAFASGKGGVGKSFCTAATALCAARSGASVAVLDLDFSGATQHVFLGIDAGLPDEDRGILPVSGPFGIAYFGPPCLAGERPWPMRGAAVTQAVRELLAVLRWGRRDLLLLDLPPGLGDHLLDLLSLLPELSCVAVSIPTRASVLVVNRMLQMLDEVGRPALGVVENMVSRPRPALPAYRCSVTASIDLEPAVEACMGSPQLLAETPAVHALAPLAKRLLAAD